MYVNHRFKLPESVIETLRTIEPPFGFGDFSKFIFYRTYSRTKLDGSKEDWVDVVVRVTEGVFSIRKDWYLRNHIHWDDDFWTIYARNFAIFMCMMKFMPPGRGLWAMGSDFVYERGSMALYNCAATEIGDEIDNDIHWMMDALMHGVGVGFGPERNDDMEVYVPRGTYDLVIEDSREGWVDSTRAKIRAYLKKGRPLPRMIYDKVRPAGLPIKGFGGISSGPEPLIRLHEQIDEFFDMYGSLTWYDSVLLKTDLANAVGCAVVAGNVRRSAELARSSINDKTFLDLKDYSKYPHRAGIGWMSNNSVTLKDPKDFLRLGEIAERVIANGEPGYMNFVNMKYGRIGKPMDGLRYDAATLLNPCGEIPLENKEVCNVSDVLPTMCYNENEYLRACEYSTFYMSTVSLLPTHRPETNAVIARNRRIGCSLIDYTGWKMEKGLTTVIDQMRKGYKRVRDVNHWLNTEAGVPDAIRVTTVKPGGTVPKLPGKTPGIGHPNFDFTLRAVRVATNSPICAALDGANVPFENDVVSQGTRVYYFPIVQGPAKPAAEVTLWEQAFNLITVQREWADNAVSNTLNFRPKWELLAHHRWSADQQFIAIDYLETYGVTSEEYADRIKEKTSDTEKLCITYRDDIIAETKHYRYDPRHEENDIEPVLAAIAPLTKSVSLLPHSAKGVYEQMPETAITEEEYFKLFAQIGKIDWTLFRDIEPEFEKYCEGDKCLLPI